MSVSIFTAFDLVLRRIREWVGDNVQDNLLLPRNQTIVLLEGVDALKARVRSAPAESAGYVPKDGDLVTFRYRTWGGGIAEFPCIWHSVERAPEPLARDTGDVIRLPDSGGD
jgi:hypothetical protein